MGAVLAVIFTIPVLAAGSQLGGRSIVKGNMNSLPERQIIPTLPCCAKTVTTTVTVTSTQAPAGTTSTTPFTCDKYGYLVQNTQLYRVDIKAGHVTSIKSSIGDNTNINAMGYNPLDNHLYARQEGKNQLIKIDNLGNSVVVGTLPTTFTAVVGDVDTLGRYWYAVLGAETWASVDLNPSSATYGKMLAQGTTAENNHVIADWTYVPVAGQYLWTVGTQRPGGGSSLMRFDMTKHTWEVVHAYPTLAVNTFGALYGINNGTIYASDNDKGTIYGFSILNNGSAGYWTESAGPSSSNNDGARCVNAAEI